MTLPVKTDWRRRLSANLGLLWSALPIPERIARAAAAGFEAVELHHPGDCAPAEVAGACERAGVRLLGVNMPSPNAAEPSARDAFRDDYRRLLDWCGAAGARALHVLAFAPPSVSRQAATAVFIENFRWAADLAAPADIGILLEPLNRHDRPAAFCHRPEEAALIIDAIARPNVGMQFDAYHAGREGLDPVASFHAHLPLVRHVQIAAVPDRGEPDRGDVDYARFLDAVARSGYGGWIGCEYVPRGDVDAGLVWRDALARRMEQA